MAEMVDMAMGGIPQVESSSEMDGKYLTFFTENQLFGVPIADVVQIVGMQEITEVPEFPGYAKGIINLRGSIIPVIDVRLRFGKAEKAYDERTCIIVTLIHDTAVGFIVDAVDAVTDIDNDNISEPPKMSGDYSSSYLTGIAKHEGKVVLLMDTQRLLSDEVVSSLTTTPPVAV
ncbi:MAG: chemotaxis protein CheW [Angelakisella sp.]